MSCETRRSGAEDGCERVLQIVESGDFFGEISLLDRGPRTAMATVLEDVKALVIDRSLSSSVAGCQSTGSRSAPW